MPTLSQDRLSSAYAFWIASLMFGLPLISSFYLVLYSPNSSIFFLVAYVLVSGIIGLFILSRQSKGATMSAKMNSQQDDSLSGAAKNSEISRRSKSYSYLAAYIALSFGTLSVATFWLMKYFVIVAYPSPNSPIAAAMGVAYLISISVSTLSAMVFLLPRFFFSFRRAISERRFLLLGVVVGTCYFFTYMILANQIIITGFNTPPGNYVPTPSGSYPFTFVFTSGPPPSALLESTVYIPEILVQLNQYFNFIFMPFEIVLAIALSALVATSVTITFSLIEGLKDRHSCLTGATVTGIGGFFGFTATCPTCLVPTLVSVFSGGVSATIPSFYSHLSGVFLPPLLSTVALVLGIVFLNHQAKGVAVIQNNQDSTNTVHVPSKSVAFGSSS